MSHPTNPEAAIERENSTEIDELRTRVRDLEVQMTACLRWMNRQAQRELAARNLAAPPQTVPKA